MLHWLPLIVAKNSHSMTVTVKRWFVSQEHVICTYHKDAVINIKKFFQNDTKGACSSSLAIIWGLLLSRQSIKSKTEERILKKKISNNIK